MHCAVRRLLRRCQPAILGFELTCEITCISEVLVSQACKEGAEDYERLDAEIEEVWQTAVVPFAAPADGCDLQMISCRL